MSGRKVTHKDTTKSKNRLIESDVLSQYNISNKIVKNNS